MGRYRSRSRSPSPRRGRKRYDDPRDYRFRRDRRSPPPSGLLVRNISLDARPEDLRISFERFGAIKDIYLPKNYYTGEPRGFGFVKFRYPEDAADAKEHLNHTVIGGREIRIVFAEENRKSPHEMHRTTRPSGRISYRRRSPVRSPRHRHRSYSVSPSPARSDLRDHRARDDDYSPRRSRSVSKSVSPRDERNYRHNMKSTRRSRSISRSISPHGERGHRSGLKSPSPRGNSKNQHDERYNEPSRLPSPRGNARHPARSPTRSLRDPSARNDDYPPGRSRSVSKSVSPRDERNYRSNMKSTRLSRSISRSLSPHGERGRRSSLRSPSPRVNSKNQHDERYNEASRLQSPRGNARNLARSRSRS